MAEDSPATLIDGASVEASPTGAMVSRSASRLLVFSSLLIVCAGYANMAVMPLWTETLIRDGVETETPVLLCCSIELAGGSIASILYSRLALSFRVSASLRIAAIIVVLANLASILLALSSNWSLPAFAASRLIAGAGSGGLLAIINARITRTAYAERLFIGAHIAFGLFASGLFQVLPRLMALLQGRALSGTLAPFATIALAGLVVSVLAPLSEAQDQSRPRTSASQLTLSSLPYLLMLGAFFCGFTSIYTFWERFGAHAGLSMAQVADMLSVASLTSLLGMGVALLVADRVGFVGPITFCLVLLSLSAWVSSHGGVLPPPLGHTLFGGAVIADQTCAIVIVPFVLSLMALQDSSGALTAAAPSAMSIGNVVGPTIATLLGRGGYERIGWMAISFYAIGFLILVLRRPRPAAAS